MRRFLFLTFALIALPLASQKQKKPVIPEQIVRARTVAVVDFPRSSGASVTVPSEDREARLAVEEALRQWGRYAVVYPQDDPDLLIVLHKGGSKLKFKGRGAGDPPVIIDDTQVRIGTRREDSTPPHVGEELGPAEDMFMIYPGHRQIDNPLDGPPIWRYVGKNVLNRPAVAAVREFRKAVDAAEKKAP